MPRITGRLLPLYCIAAFGLLAPAVSAAPLRNYTFTNLGPYSGKGGLDNGGNLIERPIRTIPNGPTYRDGKGWSGGSNLHLPSYGHSTWAEVADGTPDGSLMITSLGNGSPGRYMYKTVVHTPNSLPNPTGWTTRMLTDDYWNSIQGTKINAAGEIIGQISRVNDYSRREDGGYFYAAAGETTIHRLAELLPPGLNWKNLSLLDINDKGQILGMGNNPDGVSSNFLLTPNSVPEPGAWAVFALAAAAGWGMKRRNRDRERRPS
ncbi:PEP-CTERM sorting domain-containing protein [Planctomyces sp. SH-PL62]|uniref:PEP-CTERM sorting domain-containing protein n=1 Tax=Planctomyces sp. SH-PL62 TaxID=1636152 RepID=UPI00078BAFC0|nr:PEP-CTERM sorting domain-containing protein [Planctomyces sp. SH-PL62]AMV38586.1 hypothetical protein VT85_14205 [Planctomyces sp. SH-PL62]